MNPDGTAAPQAPVIPQVAANFVQLPGLPVLEIGMSTDPGRDPNKQINEDAMHARETPHGFLAVVCDGMGGHVGGREASHLAIETIFRHFDASPAGMPPQQVLGDALRQANAAVWSRGQASPELKGMGSTCVAILVHGGGTEIAHVGDSRVYLLTQQQIYQVTKDHSLVQRLVDANMLTPEQAANHPNANQITNAFGQRSECEVEIRPQPFPHTPGDTFVLCSDGLSDEVGPQDLLRVLAPWPSCEVATRKLVDLANARGGHDNITVVAVRLAGGGPFAVPAADAIPGASTTSPGGGQTTTAEMDVLAPPITPMGGTPIGVTSTVVGAPVSAAIPSAAPGSVPAASAPPFTPPPPYTGTPTPIEPRKKSSAGLVVGIVIVLLLVVAGVTAAILLRDPGTSTPETEPTASAEPDEDAPAPTTSEKKNPKPAPKPSIEPDPDPVPSHKPSATANGSAKVVVPPTSTTVKVPSPTTPPKEWTK